MIYNDEHGINLLSGLTHLVHTHVKPLTQVSSEFGLPPHVSTI